MHLPATMILNLADPAISKAYEAIVRDEAIDWLILGYSKVRINTIGAFLAN